MYLYLLQQWKLTAVVSYSSSLGVLIRLEPVTFVNSDCCLFTFSSYCWCQSYHKSLLRAFYLVATRDRTRSPAFIPYLSPSFTHTICLSVEAHLGKSAPEKWIHSFIIGLYYAKYDYIILYVKIKHWKATVNCWQTVRKIWLGGNTLALILLRGEK